MHEVFLAIDFGGEIVRRKLKYPIIYSDVERLKDYVKGFRMLAQYILFKPVSPYPLRLSGELYVEEKNRGGLIDFLLSEFWDGCLTIGDIGKEVRVEQISSLLLKFPYPLLIKNLNLEKLRSTSLDFYYFPSFLDFDMVKDSVRSLFVIKNIEEYKFEVSDRRIFVPTEVEPIEHGLSEEEQNTGFEKQTEGGASF